MFFLPSELVRLYLPRPPPWLPGPESPPLPPDPAVALEAAVAGFAFDFLALAAARGEGRALGLPGVSLGLAADQLSQVLDIRRELLIRLPLLEALAPHPVLLPPSAAQARGRLL